MAVEQADVAAMFRVFADVVQSRRTSAVRLREAADSRARLPGRRLLTDLLADLAHGACSVLERGYLELERRHGLPNGRPDVTRQGRAATAASARSRDVRYEAFGLDVELDGRAFHDNARARDDDATRDLDHAVTNDGRTVRLTYGQVFRDGCVTIQKIGRLLRRLGWDGQAVSCPECR